MITRARSTAVGTLEFTDVAHFLLGDCTRGDSGGAARRPQAAQVDDPADPGIAWAVDGEVQRGAARSVASKPGPEPSEWIR